MAEIRKHNPTTSDIGEQVRALLGENVRPRPPGWSQDPDDPDDDRFDPFAADDYGEDETSNVIPFRVGGAPLIGLLPSALQDWADDDNPDSAA
ncbi:MAG: hypothetical protein FWF36_06005 [Propionibacteriaceae bacterium]|nr:hypothetical protein [Propionibacteriaceae bacterium]